MSDITNKLVGDRLEAVINYYNMTPNEFARSIGFDRADKIYNVLKGKFNPSFEIITAITNKFVDIDLNWFITGQGKMLKNADEVVEECESPNKTPEGISVYKLDTDYEAIEKQSIPLYEIEASAGLSTLFSNQITQVPLDYITIPNAPKCNGAVFVRGDSMYPILKAGDIVCYKTIFNIENVYFGEMYLLDINVEGDQFFTFKYVQKSSLGKDYIRLASQNSHHDPKDVLKSHIQGLALVKVSIRYNTIS